MDQWADPLDVSALWSSRDGTMDRDADQSILAGGAAPPPLNQADALKRWDPWVRQTTGTTELTNQLVYTPTNPDTYAVAVRGAAPPGSTGTMVTLTRPNRQFFVDQLGFVQSWAEMRDERAYEVLAQIDNQFAFIAAVTGLHVTRKKGTMEWLTIAIQFTIQVELMFKHVFACYRPVDFSPQVQPIITTPGHGTYPMGHATQAFATAVALAGLLKIGRAHPAYVQLVRQARRISVNRVVAGVHFPIDAAAGQMLGTTLGEFFLNVSGIATTPCKSRSFAPTGLGNDAANDYLGDSAGLPVGGKESIPVAPIGVSPFLSMMKDLAQAEWAV